MKRTISKYSIFLIFLVLVILLAIITKGKFIQPGNILNVARQVSVIGLIAYGVTLIIITTGIDLSSGSLLALVSVVTASLIQVDTQTGTFVLYPDLPALPLIVPIIVGLVLATAIGFSNGAFVVFAKIPPFISTLGMMTIARGLAFLYSNGRPLSSLNSRFVFIGQGFLLRIPNPVWIFVFFGCVTALIMNRTKTGRYIYAIGANRRAAHVSGINTSLILLLVYMYASFLVGVAAVVQTARIDSGQAGLGISYELFAIASASIGGTSFTGGRGSISGTFIGAMIIGVIKNGMDILAVSPYWQQVVLGLIIIFAVVLDQRKYAAQT